MDNYTAELIGLKRGGMPPRSKKYFRPTKAGAGMTQAGVEKYRRDNPGSKLKRVVRQQKEENLFVQEVRDKLVCII